MIPQKNEGKAISDKRGTEKTKDEGEKEPDLAVAGRFVIEKVYCAHGGSSFFGPRSAPLPSPSLRHGLTIRPTVVCL
jgi:hypothetical protein